MGSFKNKAGNLNNNDVKPAVEILDSTRRGSSENMSASMALQESYPCPMCDKTFKCEKTLVTHSRKHDEKSMKTKAGIANNKDVKPSVKATLDSPNLESSENMN